MARVPLRLEKVLAFGFLLCSLGPRFGTHSGLIPGMPKHKSREDLVGWVVKGMLIKVNETKCLKRSKTCFRISAGRKGGLGASLFGRSGLVVLGARRGVVSCLEGVGGASALGIGDVQVNESQCCRARCGSCCHCACGENPPADLCT